MQIRVEKDKKEIKEHGNFAFPVNIAIEKIQKYESKSFLWHWHPEIEITLILSGELRYRVNNAIHTLVEGDGIFVNSNALHTGKAINGENCTYLVVTFHPRFLYGYENSILQTKYVNLITTNEALGKIKLSPDIDWQKRILDSMKLIYDLKKNPPKDYELQIHQRLMDIWQGLYDYYSAKPVDNSKQKVHIQRLKRIISYIQENYDQEIKLDDVAEAASICKSECCRFFKKYMNMTIFDYVLYYRVQMSIPLLREYESITEVASMVGFSSASYFTQIFKRYMGFTPMQFKKGTADL